MKLPGLVRALAAVATLALSFPCLAQSNESAIAAADSTAPQPKLGGIELSFSPYTIHYSPSPEHRNVYLVGLTKGDDDGWYWGGAAFSNSFGQPCVYGFVGRKFLLTPFGLNRFYASVNGGIIYGYKPPYENKVPLNHHGFSPGLIPSIGYQFTKEVSGQVQALGSAGLMFTLTIGLPQNRK